MAPSTAPNCPGQLDEALRAPAPPHLSAWLPASEASASPAVLPSAGPPPHPAVSWVRVPVFPAARAMLVWLRLGPQGLGQHMEERALSIYLEDTQQLSRRPGFNSEGPCVNIQMWGPYHELTCKQFFGRSNVIY